MPKYMFLGGYSPESWHRMMEHPGDPGDRQAAVNSLCQEAGGSLEAFYWTFGPDDYVYIADLPDDASASAISAAISSSGELHDHRTVKLITEEEGQTVLTKGKELASHYRRPGG